MLRCYLLALATGSSVDQLSNNFTLFNLVEQVNVVEDALGKELFVELHAYWFVDETARDKDFELRVVRVPSEGGAEDVGAALPLHAGPQARVRFRTGRLRLPKAYGDYLLAVEWRPKGAETWNREAASWPLVLAPPAAPENETPPKASVVKH